MSLVSAHSREALRARTTRTLTASEEGLAKLIELAEDLVHARPASEEEAKAALEWIAAREGKGLDELIEECRRHLATR